MKGTRGILEALLVIVIGLALVATVATSTSSASTALAPFSGAQALVIIVPLIFVAIILFAAYKHVSHATSLEARIQRKILAAMLFAVLRAIQRLAVNQKYQLE